MEFKKPHAAWYHHTLHDLVAEHGDPSFIQIADAVDEKFWELNEYTDDALVESDDLRLEITARLDALIGNLLDA